MVKYFILKFSFLVLVLDESGSSIGFFVFIFQNATFVEVSFCEVGFKNGVDERVSTVFQNFNVIYGPCLFQVEKTKSISDRFPMIVIVSFRS